MIILMSILFPPIIFSQPSKDILSKLDSCRMMNDINELADVFWNDDDQVCIISGLVTSFGHIPSNLSQADFSFSQIYKRLEQQANETKVINIPIGTVLNYANFSNTKIKLNFSGAYYMQINLNNADIHESEWLLRNDKIPSFELETHCNKSGGQPTLIKQLKKASYNRCIIPQIIKKQKKYSFWKQKGYRKKINKIFASSHFDYFPNHNQTLDSMKAFNKIGILKGIPATLIHFDTHSDMCKDDLKKYLKNKSFGSEYSKDAFEHSIWSYVNTMIRGNQVNNVYWVIPDGTKRSRIGRQIFWNKKDIPVYTSILFNGEFSQKFYIKKGNISKEEPIHWSVPEDYDNNASSYRIINFYKIVLNDLLNIKIKSPIILDIDADYFSNTGYDTIGKFEVKFKEDTITNFISILDKANIRPVVTTGSLSPQYVGDEYVDIMERFFQDIGISSFNKNDYLIGYRHQDKQGFTIRGNNIVRHENALFTILYKLNMIDLRTSNPDYQLAMVNGIQEYEDAKKMVKKILKASKKDALSFMKKMDKQDGTLNGIIHFRDIEHNIRYNMNK